jgi:cyclophilin family peptidyl-prolyl cis-trans isomerase
VRGTVSMARTGDPNSANSQFFICFDDAPWLDRQYTVWGKVVEGMEHVDAIKKGGEHNNGAISGAPDKIVKMRGAGESLTHSRKRSFGVRGEEARPFSDYVEGACRFA